MIRMKKFFLWMIAAILTCGLPTACSKDDNASETKVRPSVPLRCVKPSFLKAGDKVALISPSYATPMGNVEKTAEVLRSWGLVPVVGPNVGKIVDGRYAGTVAERVSDIQWAFSDQDIKAIVCNRGGYGTIQCINQLSLNQLSENPKWLVGFSDISTLHGLLARAGMMSIHGTMSSFLAAGGQDSTSLLMRDILMGRVPRYETPAHPQNITGRAQGVLVGGNLCTFVPNLGSQADATLGRDIILFIEEVEESMHNIDRQMNILKMNGVLDRCKGVVLGEFTDCGNEFTYGSVEAMLHQFLAPYKIPVLCGFPAGHGNVNFPLVMGAPVTLDVRADGGTLTFDIDGEQQQVQANPDRVNPVDDNSQFVTLTDVIPDAILEIRYYGTYNFVGDRIDGYLEPTALLTKEAADSLKAVSDDVKKLGYRLKIYDAYRPQVAVDHFVRWAANVSDTRMKPYFYPDLDKSVLFDQEYIMEKSGHTRGSTLDMTLFDMATEKEVDMGGTFDWFGPESHPDFCGNPETGLYTGDNHKSPVGRSITPEQFANRMILRRAMMRHGFRPLDTEWWHFTLNKEPFPDTYFNFPVKAVK